MPVLVLEKDEYDGWMESQSRAAGFPGYGGSSEFKDDGLILLPEQQVSDQERIVLELRSSLPSRLPRRCVRAQSSSPLRRRPPFLGPRLLLLRRMQGRTDPSKGRRQAQVCQPGAATSVRRGRDSGGAARHISMPTDQHSRRRHGSGPNGGGRASSAKFASARVSTVEGLALSRAIHRYMPLAARRASPAACLIDLVWGDEDAEGDAGG